MAGASRALVGSALSSLGGTVGSYLGGPVGGLLGSAAGKLVANVTGYGDYKVNRNSLVTGSPVPTFREGGDGVVISHREFLTNVAGSVAFALTSFRINPGLVTTFPWLSRLAQNFEEYEMEGLLFQYRPTSGSAVSSTSSALGAVIMATDYDVLNPNFATKQQMESYQYSTSTVPFAALLHPVECARRKNVLDNLYVRSSAPPAEADPRMYDLGNFQIATEGMQTVYTVGELWVTYHVRFRKPRLSFTDIQLAYTHIKESPANSATTGTAFFGTDGGIVNTGSPVQPYAAPGGTVDVSSLLLPIKGEFCVFIVASDAGASIVGNVTEAFAAGSNLSVGSAMFVNNSVGSVKSQIVTTAMAIYHITVSNSGYTALNRIAFTCAGLSTGQTDAIVFPISAAAFPSFMRENGPRMIQKLTTAPLTTTASLECKDCWVRDL